MADVRGLQLSGFLAWLTWLFVHIMYLVQFQNRILVLVQWSFNYFTKGRRRLITRVPDCTNTTEPDHAKPEPDHVT